LMEYPDDSSAMSAVRAGACGGASTSCVTTVCVAYVASFAVSASMRATVASTGSASAGVGVTPIASEEIAIAAGNDAMDAHLGTAASCASKRSVVFPTSDAEARDNMERRL